MLLVSFSQITWVHKLHMYQQEWQRNKKRMAPLFGPSLLGPRLEVNGDYLLAKY